MRRAVRALGWVLCCVALAFALSCRIPRESPRSRYWVLDAGDAALAEGPIERQVGVAPVEIPSYLDRPEIVTRRSATRLEVASFDLWAQPLPEAIAAAVARQLELRLPGTRAAPTGRRTPDVELATRLWIEIARFEAGPGSDVSLEAFWILEGDRRDSGPAPAQGRAAFREPVAGQGIEAVVAAMSRALDRLGERIAAALQDAPPG